MEVPETILNIAVRISIHADCAFGRGLGGITWVGETIRISARIYVCRKGRKINPPQKAIMPAPIPISAARVVRWS